MHKRRTCMLSCFSLLFPSQFFPLPSLLPLRVYSQLFEEFCNRDSSLAAFIKGERWRSADPPGVVTPETEWESANGLMLQQISHNERTNMQGFGSSRGKMAEQLLGCLLFYAGIRNLAKYRHHSQKSSWEPVAGKRCFKLHLLCARSRWTAWTMRESCDKQRGVCVAC